MAQIVTVPSSVDDSSKLQKLIDSKGNTPTTYEFSEGQDIEINSRIRLFNFTEWNGNGVFFHLADKISTSTFPSGVPLIAPKYPTSTERLILHDFSVDGNRDSNGHVASLTENGKAWGNGFHNVIMLGVLDGVSYNNAKNCEFYNIKYKNSLGDLLRCEGSTNTIAHDITASRGGHDVICLAGTLGGEVYNLTVDAEVNAAVRTRSSKNIKIHNCKINGNTGKAYAPMFEIQNTAIGKNWIQDNIEIYNNYIYGSWGPGIQVVSDQPNNGTVYIHHNLFEKCGLMPAANKKPGVGAIVHNGHHVKIWNNTIVNSSGYGILAGNYNVSCPYSYSAEIYRNIITGTKKSYYAGTGSGSGIAKLTKDTIKCYENDLWDNVSNLYSVTQTSGYSTDPLFTSDYNLQVNSPCLNLGFDAKTDDTMIETTVNYRRWSTLYAEYDDATTVQETVVIKGEAGKQIHLTNLALRLRTAKAGSIASARVVIAGFKDTDFEENMITYKDHSQAVNFLAPVGADMTLKFHLKTSSKAVRAYMEDLRYSYELVDPVEQEVIRVGDTIEIVIQRDNGTEKLVGVIEKKS